MTAKGGIEEGVLVSIRWPPIFTTANLPETWNSMPVASDRRSSCAMPSPVSDRALLKDVADEDRLSGRGELHADVSIVGLKEKQIRRSLNGTSRFAFRWGTQGRQYRAADP